MRSPLSVMRRKDYVLVVFSGRQTFESLKAVLKGVLQASETRGLQAKRFLGREEALEWLKGQ